MGGIERVVRGKDTIQECDERPDKRMDQTSAVALFETILLTG